MLFSLFSIKLVYLVHSFLIRWFLIIYYTRMKANLSTNIGSPLVQMETNALKRSDCLFTSHVRSMTKKWTFPLTKGKFGTDPDVITCLEEIILLVYFTRSFTDLKKDFSANKRQIWDWSRCHYMSLRDHIACYNPAHTM